MSNELRLGDIFIFDNGVKCKIVEHGFCLPVLVNGILYTSKYLIERGGYNMTKIEGS